MTDSAVKSFTFKHKLAETKIFVVSYKNDFDSRLTYQVRKDWPCTDGLFVTSRRPAVVGYATLHTLLKRNADFADEETCKNYEDMCLALTLPSP